MLPAWGAEGSLWGGAGRVTWVSRWSWSSSFGGQQGLWGQAGRCCPASAFLSSLSWMLPGSHRTLGPWATAQLHPTPNPSLALPSPGKNLQDAGRIPADLGHNRDSRPSSQPELLCSSP